MTYYNESAYDNATYFWDFMVAGNTVSSDNFFLLFLLLAPFMLTLIIIKSTGRSNASALLGGSSVLTFVSILMFALGSVGQHIPIICTTVFGSTIILYKLVD